MLALGVCDCCAFHSRGRDIEGSTGEVPPCSTFYQCLGANMVLGFHGDIAPLFGDPVAVIPEGVNMHSMIQVRCPLAQSCCRLK